MFLRAAPHTIKLCGGPVPVDLLLADEVSDGRSTYIHAGSEPLTAETVRHAPWQIDIGRRDGRDREAGRASVEVHLPPHHVEDLGMG